MQGPSLVFRSSSRPRAMKSSIRHYSLSDNLKRIISGERETVFRLLESRFCVEIRTRLPGLDIVPLDDADMSGVLAVLDQLKIAARNGEILDAHQLERMLGPKETPVTEPIPDSPVFRNRFGISVSAKTPAQAELGTAGVPKASHRHGSRSRYRQAAECCPSCCAESVPHPSAFLRNRNCSDVCCTATAHSPAPK